MELEFVNDARDELVPLQMVQHSVLMLQHEPQAVHCGRIVRLKLCVRGEQRASVLFDFVCEAKTMIVTHKTLCVKKSRRL